MNPEDHPLTTSTPSTEPTTLECGCVYEPGSPAKFKPCGELHRDIALRFRKPGARWLVVQPLEENPS